MLRHILERPDAVNLITEGGRRVAEIAGEMREVVVIGSNDLAAMTVPGPEGIYLVGTGTVGCRTNIFYTRCNLLCCHDDRGLCLSPSCAGLETGGVGATSRG